MWDNTEDDVDDTGFPALFDHARLMGWLCLIGAVGAIAVVLLK